VIFFLSATSKIHDVAVIFGNRQKCSACVAAVGSGSLAETYPSSSVAVIYEKNRFDGDRHQQFSCSG
jgi:hypothetical protein